MYQVHIFAMNYGDGGGSESSGADYLMETMSSLEKYR